MNRSSIRHSRTPSGVRPARAVVVLAGVIALFAGPAATAQQTPPPVDAPPPPPIREPLPPKVIEPDDELAPEVVIRQEEDRTVEEYISGGRVYMVRITPTIGAPYYLIDTTGDGLLDLRHETFEPVKPVYWKLFEW
ncbi:DUF2782 domain-containing protein [Wenzhouxiangella sp. XN79A]|uniref:DUF2782 domain-containing protein n=1 Tax=Wenzhouxiangella sp. XN79A TaxID=2724193 RepID=UPI00144AB40C|nr:DUF2782 domain-containing protein [Wenzhouxiangella sp. XN79A]NKI35247.1 DUF2782 domain-containing protein [Wenzhouxiangella sp. XN79A]